MQTLLFAGGDQRTLAAIRYIQSQGFRTLSYALETRRSMDASKASAIILPFPCLKNGRINAPALSDPPSVEEMIQETGIDPETAFVIGGPMKNCPFARYTDLSLCEDLKLRNAVTTAEGALELIMKHTPRAIFGASVLILGYGAIGKRLTDLLLALGARVTVAARRETDRVAAQFRGCTVQNTEQLSLKEIDVLVNTVPFRLIDESVLQTREESLYALELASPPYGMDPAFASTPGLHYIPGPALPGKVAPLTAGEDLAKTVLRLLPDPETKGSGTPLGT